MNWKHQVDIQPIINEYMELDESDFTTHAFNNLCERVATTLEKNPILKTSEFPAEFRFIKDEVDLEAFDDSLQSLYDFCDANSIWLGI